MSSQDAPAQPAFTGTGVPFDPGPNANTETLTPPREAAAEFSPTGDRVLSTAEDGAARLRDIMTGTPLTEPLRHDAPVSGVAFSPDGRLAITSAAKVVRVWDASDGRSFSEPLRHGYDAHSSEFIGYKDFPRIRTNDGIWDAPQGNLKAPTWASGQSQLGPRSFSPDSQLALVFLGRNVQVRKIAAPEKDGISLKVSTDVEGAEFSRDGKWIVTACRDGTAQVWSAATGSPGGAPMLHKDIVRCASFSPDGAQVLTSSHDGMVQLWEAATGKALGEPWLAGGDGKNKNVWSARFSADGKWILTGTDERVQVWEAASRKPVFQANASGPFLPPGATQSPRLRSCELSPDGQRLVTVSDNAQLWDVPSGGWMPLDASYGGHRSVGGDSQLAPVRHAGFSPDGTLIAMAIGNQAVVVANDDYHRVVGILRHEGIVESVAFSPDGRRVVTASQDGSARIWETRTGRPLSEPFREKSSVSTAAFTPDGQHILTGNSDGEARLWDAGFGGEGTVPEWFTRFVEAVGNLRFNEFGALKNVAVSNQPFKERGQSVVKIASEFPEEILAQVLEGSKADKYLLFARWFLDRTPERPTLPP